MGAQHSVMFTGRRVIIAHHWDGALFGPAFAGGYCRYTVRDAHSGRRVASIVSDAPLGSDAVFDDHWMLVGHPLNMGFAGGRHARLVRF